MNLPTQLLSETATVPTRGTEEAAGLDLYLDLGQQMRIENQNRVGEPLEWDEDSIVALDPRNRAVLRTGVAVAIPKGYYGQIAPRSGLAVKHGLEILAGIIDSDYRGELMIAALNSGHGRIEFKHGDRIAQLLILPCAAPDPVIYDTLDETARGDGKFGSTGK